MKRDAVATFWILGVAAISIATACGLPSVEREPGALSQQLQPVRPAAAAVDDFDRLIQARFEDLRDNKFGVSRVGRLGPKHRRLFEPRDGVERLTLERLRAAGWTTTMYVVEPRSATTLFGGVRGPVDTGRPVELRPHSDPDLEALAARAMSAKAPAQGMIDGFPMEARPVLASSKACLACHSDRQLGDPLGAVVYSFSPDPFAPLAAK